MLNLGNYNDLKNDILHLTEVTTEILRKESSYIATAIHTLFR